MMEHITFPEEKIPEVVKIIRRGIKELFTISEETKEQLEKQCKQLEQYWKNQINDD